ncbi:competence protein ComGB [Planomicrobium soli]|uniref:Competence protein ComGB n=1 Tax=Planomicrobium soli TaxID=1176648 RepID=A0A2P8H4M5_9BACL|nr:competence protein ComGB [Planomicrobium soli]
MILPARQNRITLYDREHFLTRLSVLMKEGYLLPTALTLLLPLHTQKVDEAINGMTAILKDGGNVAEIFKFFGFKDGVLLPVEIAEHHGRLAEAIDSIAKSYARTENVQKKLKALLIYPVSLLIFTSILFLFFRTNYVPNLTQLMESMQSGEEAGGVPDLLLKLPDLFIGLFAFCALIAFAFFQLLKKQRADKQIQWILSVPVFRRFMKLYWSHLFARELGTLLHSGISIQESLDLLKSQTHHPIIGFMSSGSQDEIQLGQPLSIALSRFEFIAGDMPTFVRHGEMTGYLGKELILYSEVLMERIELKTQQLLRIIQPAFFLMIAVCIIGAYLAILLPMYNLVQTI